MIQRFLVMAVAAGNDKAVGAPVDLVPGKILESLANIADQQLSRRGKALAAGVAFAVVEHPDVEIDLGSEAAHGLADVAAADDQQRDAR